MGSVQNGGLFCMPKSLQKLVAKSLDDVYNGYEKVWGEWLWKKLIPSVTLLAALVLVGCSSTLGRDF